MTVDVYAAPRSALPSGATPTSHNGMPKKRGQAAGSPAGSAKLRKVSGSLPRCLAACRTPHQLAFGAPCLHAALIFCSAPGGVRARALPRGVLHLPPDRKAGRCDHPRWRPHEQVAVLRRARQGRLQSEHRGGRRLHGDRIPHLRVVLQARRGRGVALLRGRGSAADHGR